MKWRLSVLTALTILVRVVPSPGGSLTPDDLKRVGYDQHLGQEISAGLAFRDSDGRSVTIGELRNTKPTLLVLGYYHCPMLCTLINDGMIESLQELRFDIGRDFNVINVSIDPNETPQVAAVKKREYLRRYGRQGADGSWHFLTGREEMIAQLAQEAGFRYRYDEGTHQYAHPSGFLVLTPGGKISRYFFGVNFDPKELRTALITAGKGEQGSLIQQLVLLCCQYNPITGKYGPVVLGVLRVGGVATVLLMVWGIVRLCRASSPTPGSEAS